MKACLRECLTLWLQWDYDIEQLGKPTMESLAAAVYKMDLKAVASGILGKNNGALNPMQQQQIGSPLIFTSKQIT